MSVKIGINGFGRIGKLVFRLLSDTPGLEVVQLNDKMNSELIAHLLRYDSVHGRYNADVTFDRENIFVNGRQIRVSSNPDPSAIRWQETGTELVIDSSGSFTTRSLLEGHLNQGVRVVILSCPPADDSIERTVVLGVNNHQITSSDTIVSNASCTTNCAAIMLKVLRDEFGVSRAFMNTVHPPTNSQNLQDGFHSDFRRARSALNNIILTTTSAVRTMHLLFPDMKEKFDGFATRVPVSDCSLVEMTAQLKKDVTVQQVNEAFGNYANGTLKGLLEYCSDPVVSSDIRGNYHSAVFDSLSTKVIGGDMVQIVAWYDNESGYSARIVDLIHYITAKWER